MNAQFCSVCHLKPRFFDHQRGCYSATCSRTCQSRLSQQSQPQQTQPRYNPQTAVQGQPICRMCNNAAFFDGRDYSPGCGRYHANQAIQLGFRTPR